jgi:hypothetical protein
MSLTISTKTYEADAAVSANQIPYKGPSHTISVKDRLDLYRTDPKGTTTFSGVARARAKFVRTLTLTGAKTVSGDAIGDINVSVPVGASDAVIDALCDDIAAFTGSAAFKLQCKKLDITH